MVPGQVPAKVEVGADELEANFTPAVTNPGAAEPVTDGEVELLPRTVTVTVAVAAAAQVDAEAVVAGSVQASPAMENLSVCA